MSPASDSRVLVLGSVNVDFVIRGAVLPRPGETVLGGRFFEAPGGKGANQAVAAARAATSGVALIAAVGNDRLGGDSIARLTAEPNLLADFIKTIAGASTGVALILVDHQGENLISVASGANLNLRPDDIDCLPDSLFEGANVLLACLESPLDAVAQALRRAKKRGMRTILNPAPAMRELVDSAILELVDVLTPNEHELATLANFPITNERDLLAAARVLQALGCGAVVVTRRAAGCAVVEAQPTWIAAPEVVAVDSTAAGDAFNGALAVRLSEGATLSEAARWATLAASLSVTQLGAQPSLPRRAAIEHFAESAQSQ